MTVDDCVIYSRDTPMNIHLRIWRHVEDVGDMSKVSATFRVFSKARDMSHVASVDEALRTRGYVFHKSFPR